MELNELAAALKEDRNLVLVAGKPFILEGLDPKRPKNGVMVRNFEGKGFVCAPEQVRVIGSVDLGALGPKAEPRKPQRNLFGTRLANGEVVKPGDTVTLRDGRTATFDGYSARSPRFPMQITMDGKARKCSLEFVVGRAGGAVAPAPKRPEADLLRLLAYNLSAREPETLTCDGERSRSEIQRVLARLNQERDQLVQELGYEPSEDDLWNILLNKRA